jgi:hypothetical protein
MFAHHVFVADDGTVSINPAQRRTAGQLALRSTPSNGIPPACPQRADSRADVVGAAVASAIDEERGCAGDAAEVGGIHVRRDLGFLGVAGQADRERPGWQAA